MTASASDRWEVVRDRMWSGARWVVSLGLLAVLAWLVDLREVYRVLLSAEPGWLLVALALALSDRLLMAGKWYPLLQIQLPDVSVGKAVRAYFASSFAGIFLPASIGGDLLRTTGLGRDHSAVMEVGASVVVERVLGLVGSAIITLVALWIAFVADVRMGFLVPWALAGVGTGLVAVTVPFSRRIRRTAKSLFASWKASKWTAFLERFASAYSVYRTHRRTLGAVGLLSVVEQLFPVFVYGACALALQLDVSIASLMVAVPLTVFAARLPISVAGVGITEGGLVYLLGLFGMPASEVLSLAIAGRVVDLLALAPGAIWWKDLTGSVGDLDVFSRSAKK